MRELSLGDLDVKDLRLVDRLHPYDLGHQGLIARVSRNAGLGAAVVVDDGVHAAVVRGHRAQVGDGQPSERDVPQPAALDEQRVEHLVVGRALVGLVLHGLRPRGEQLLGAVGPVEEADGAADVGRAALGDVGLVGPKVEERDVARPLRPRAGQEELRELVELEVDVEVDDGLRRLLDLGQQEDAYNWGTAELIEFESAFDGETMQAILYKPENFDPSKKYPMIVYFYERSTNGLYRHFFANDPFTFCCFIFWMQE